MLFPKSVPQIYEIFFVRNAFPQKCSPNIRDIFWKIAITLPIFELGSSVLPFWKTSAHVDFKSDDNNKEDEDNKDKNIKGYKNILLRL